ncbi:MAG: cysteine desulfurase [Rhodospirillaceae bacterium]|nr:cysteine desulfurase [Rhodospirillaceae bacterium]
MQTSVYLDYNATAPARPGVIDAISETLRLGAINPSSVHGPGREARKRVERAREQVAAMVGAEADQVVFTGSGTEANNLVITGSGHSRMLVSAVEHAAVLRTALTKAADCDVIPVLSDGVVDLAALETMLADDDTPTLVSVMAANNETGVLQPIADVVRIARAHGAKVHTDAVQAAGKIEIDFAAWDVDFMTLSAHKIGGPQGVGAVICRSRELLRPMVLGGGQENGLRAGTENVAGIVGFGVAAEMAAAEQADEALRLAALRDGMETALKAEAPHLKVVSDGAPRLPNTSCLTMPGVRNDTQVMAFDLAGIAVSAGSACSAGKVEPSHVLDAMGIADDEAVTAVRISLGEGSTDTHINSFVRAWLELWNRKGNSRTVAA